MISILLATFLFQCNTVCLENPRMQLAEDSVVIRTVEPKTYSEWTNEEHLASYSTIQKVGQLFDQFLVFGEIQDPFYWEIVPHYKTNYWITEKWQQGLVLWKIAYGRVNNQKQNWGPWPEPYTGNDDSSDGQDPFCNPAVIEKQQIYEGDFIRLIYNYAPIGENGLHFLIIPKEHRTNFRSLTEEEYMEATKITKLMINSFAGMKGYLYHKTGKDGGQSVFHWHQHIVFTSSDESVAKALLTHHLSPSILTNEQLQDRVNRFKSILIFD